MSSCNVSISELLKLPGQNTLEREREAGEKDLEYLRQKKVREEREIIERIEEVNNEGGKKEEKKRGKRLKKKGAMWYGLNTRN